MGEKAVGSKGWRLMQLFVRSWSGEGSKVEDYAAPSVQLVV